MTELIEAWGAEIAQAWAKFDILIMNTAEYAELLRQPDINNYFDSYSRDIEYPDFKGRLFGMSVWVQEIPKHNFIASPQLLHNLHNRLGITR